MDGDVRVLEWEEGLPAADDLTPLSQPLITPELAAAFGVAPEPQRSLLDVHRASQETLESLRRRKAPPLAAQVEAQAPAPALEEEADNRAEDEEEELGDPAEGELAEDPSGRASAAKKPRLLWTPQLHKRFVEVVAYLGIKKAVPKTIMQLMNVEGLTRENVASHLQKYRLYLKRSSLGDGDSSPEKLYASASKDNSIAVPAVVPYAANPAVVPPPMPVLGGRAHAGVVMPVNGQMRGGPYPMFAAHRPYAVLGQPTGWPGRNNIGSNSLPQRALPDTVT